MKKILALLILLIYPSISLFSQRAAISISNVKEKDRLLSIKVHNDARKEVGTPPLEWSIELANDAQNYADNLARYDGRLVHSAQRGQGENLYKIWTSNGGLDNLTKNPAESASICWYDEIKFYRYSKVRRFRFGPAVGHYTQMIWDKTTHFGIGWSVSKTGKYYVVARYSPPGNWIKEYPYKRNK